MNTGRAVMGSALVAVGGLLLLDQQDVLDAGAVIADWWPVLFLLAAVFELLARPPKWVSATVFGVLGLLLLATTADVLDATVRALLWPLAIIGLGVWLLARRPPRPSGTSPTATDGGEALDVTSVFSGRRVVSTAARFRGGSVTAVLGGVDVDLVGARIEREAVLDVVALFGGIDIEVPLGWHVVVDGPAVFGGHDNNVPATSDPDAPTLRVRATAIFGGVEVKLGRNVAVPPAPVLRGA